jgi:hypothetical protein
MAKTWEHYHHAARNHEKAAYHFNEAAKFNQAQEGEKAAHHAYLAHGHSQQAIHHAAEAAKLHAEHYASQPATAAEQEVKNQDFKNQVAENTKNAASSRDETSAKTAERS